MLERLEGYLMPTKQIMITKSYFIVLLIFAILIACKPDQQGILEGSVVDNPQELLLSLDALAEYEKEIDHGSYIEQMMDEEENWRLSNTGAQIYKNTCFTCHGDMSQEGSIPTSTKFWEADLKHGSDPYAIYETLTRGFGQMAPQVQLVPREKYAVIHFIREHFLKDQNSSNYTELSEDYIATLPAGSLEGPAATEYKPWEEMDYGNFLIRTYEMADSTTAPREISGGPSPLKNENLINQNFAYKGIAVRLDEGEGGIARGNAFLMFDADLMRMAGAWTGDGFIDYQAILMNERHNIYPRTVGDLHVELPVEPGWANPQTGEYDDPRFEAVDGRQFGPLPREWAHYKGLYSHEDRVVVKYTVGDATIFEMYNIEQQTPRAIFSRTINITASSTPLQMRVAPADVSVGISPNIGVAVDLNDDFHELHIPANKELQFKVYFTRDAKDDLANLIVNDNANLDLSTYTKGGPAKYHEKQITQVKPGPNTDAYAADVLALPLVNPWKARVRPTGIDFIPGTDEAVVCTIDGDVWIIGNITSNSGELTWQRIATGLFQPLGIVYTKDQIFITCRDALVVLRDFNGDRETDFYEAYNTDHQVTEHFHEFAMGLQIDEAGNFYYAKSARHARDKLIPQHGTLIRVSPDGETSTIIANGFRAANGVCLNPDGTFIVTDQEGHWNPMNRINYVQEGGFYGNMYSYGAPADTSDAAMIQPLCWVDMRFDRSPAELLWVDSDQWGPLNGSLLNISYGYGRIFNVLTEKVNGIIQGGMSKLNLPDFPSGLVRGRFHPSDGQLYTCAMTAWATSQVLQAGGLYRIRYTEQDLNLATGIKSTKDGISIEFANELDNLCLLSCDSPSPYTM